MMDDLDLEWAMMGGSASLVPLNTWEYMKYTVVTTDKTVIHSNHVNRHTFVVCKSCNVPQEMGEVGVCKCCGSPLPMPYE